MRIIVISYAGITRFRFDGYDLSRSARHPDYIMMNIPRIAAEVKYPACKNSGAELYFKV